MSQTFLNYIDGKWVPARSRKTFFNTNPADGTVLGEFPASGPDDVNDAVEAAATAYRSWRLVPAPKRAEVVYRAGEIIRARKDDLARAMTREMGKILAETKGRCRCALRSGSPA
jgi:aldehyde dehydrogenase (NAD+)